jgi:hypothetical protein
MGEMMLRIVKIMPLPQYRLRVEFDDGVACDFGDSLRNQLISVTV